LPSRLEAPPVMRFNQASAVAVAAAAVVSLAAGCSTSQPAGGIEAPGAAAAAAARYQVTTTLRTIYDRWLYGARIGYATSLDGSFQACLGARSQLSYHGEMQLYPLGGKVSGGAFTRRITGALRRHGWRVYPQKFITVPPPERVYSYAFTEGRTGGLMYVVAGQQGHAPTARFDLQSQCFRPLGQALSGHPDRLSLPHPASRQ
jgi:hypothetical protein